MATLKFLGLLAIVVTICWIISVYFTYYSDKYSKKQSCSNSDYFVAPTAIVEKGAIIGKGTKIWHFTHVRKGARIGENCTIGSHSVIDQNVVIGKNCKIQAGVLIYDGVILEDGVFVGPGVRFTNVRNPRAIRPDGTKRTTDDWKPHNTLVETGVAIGTGAIIVCGNTIGRWSMIAAGAVVTKTVQPFEMMGGIPARQIGFVCKCGHRAKGLVCKYCKQNISMVYE